MKVLLLDNVDAVCADILKKRGIEADLVSKLDQEKLYETISNYDGLVVRSATKVTEELIQHAKGNLKVVGRAGVGVDNIDIEAATKLGVLVMNTPDGNTISTAEHACGLILSLVRNIPNAVASLKAGRWDRKLYMGTEVHGKTLGVVGLGKIGSSVAERMKSFGMNIIGYDPYMTTERAAEIGVKLVDMDELLANSDIITVHTPLTEKTRGLISRANASKLKKGVRLVNCARGGIFDESDLLGLLEDGTVSEVALDVYTTEPVPESLHELLKHPKVVCTPHLGASTEEAQEKVAVQIAEQIADALENKNYKGSLNGKSIALSTDREVQPLLELADRLGKFACQTNSGNPGKITLEYSGKCAEKADILTDAFLSGYLFEIADNAPVNLINARYLADQKGIEITEAKTKSSKTYADLITVKLDGSPAYKHISGTIFNEQDHRVVNIDGLDIELHLKGTVILYRNVDRPGMLAAVSSKLAENDINIAALSLGRAKDTSRAVTGISIDKDADKDTLSAIIGMDGVEHVKYLKL